jgi:hypothetical protein
MSNKTITFDNVDVKMLDAQKEALVDKLLADQDSILWGLVEMLDKYEVR